MADESGNPIVEPVDDSVFDQFLQPPQNQPATELVGKPANPNVPIQPHDDSIFDQYIQPELKAAEHDNAADMAKAFAQGLGKGALGPIAPAAQVLAGRDPTAMLETEEQHPYLTGAGELAGLVGTGVVGKGAGAVLGSIGKLAEVGEGASTVAKIGSKAAQGALENVAFQTSDELSRLIMNDPNQSIGSAAADLGAAGILGSAFGLGAGSANALWAASKGSDTAKVLKTLVNKAGGLENEGIDQAVQNTIDQAGIELEPELRGALSSDPVFNDMFNTLRQTDTTKAGRDIQKTYNAARNRASDAMIETLGRSPKEVQNLSEFSKYEAGKDLGNTIASAYKTQVEPIASKFQDYRNKYGKVELQPDVHTLTGDTIPGAMSQTVDKIAKLAIDEGWTTSPSSDVMKEVNRVMNELPLQKNLKDLTNYVSQIGQNTWDVMNPSLTRAGRLMKNIVKEAESGAMVNKIGITEGVEALEDFSKAKSAYAAQSELKDALNDRLHIKGANTANFSEKLREMAKTDGEAIYNRLSGKNDAHLLGFLAKNYPEAANILRNQHLDQILKKAVDKAAPNMSINGEQLARGIKQLSPELQSFVASPEALTRLSAIDEMMQKFNQSPYNFSNTARTFDKMIEYMPSTATGMIAALATGNPVMGGLVGLLTKYVGKEIPDAIKLGLLKFMGSNKPINAAGFKASVDMIHSIQKGERLLNQGAKKVFNIGSEGTIKGWSPSASDRMRLDKQIQLVNESQNDPDSLTKNDDVGHYMPDHGMAIASTAARITSYLQSQKPGADRNAPLDSKPALSPIKQAEYERALDLALNPMILLDKVKTGSVTTNDLLAVKSMYPDLFNRMISKVSQEMADNLAKNKQVPYSTRIGISMLMGQPMDSTLSPAAFAASNPVTQIQPQMPQGSSNSKSKGSPSSPALQKLPSAYKTPNEARQSRMQRDK